MGRASVRRPQQRYGGVYPLLIGTDTRHDYQDIKVTSIGWNAGARTLTMGFNRSFEELDVYPGASDLASVKINGATLTPGTDYTFDPVTHILRIMKTSGAGVNFTVSVTVV